METQVVDFHQFLSIQPEQKTLEKNPHIFMLAQDPVTKL